jgi:hypothetical protein
MLLLTLSLMQRPHYDTVTGIPVLTPCEPRDHEGLATWLGDVRETRQHVWELTQAHLDPNSKKSPLRVVPKPDREFFLAVVALLQGLEKKDRIAIAGARERVVIALGRERGVGLNSEWVQRVASQLGLKPGREAKAIELGTLGPGQSEDIRWLFSGVVSGELDSVRLVLWWSDGRFRPALYCPDLKSALFTFILMKIVAGRGWGVCPHCGDFFIQKRSDQTYCTIAHREAHRVARWRAAKVRRLKKKGGQNGARKTR